MIKLFIEYSAFVCFCVECTVYRQEAAEHFLLYLGCRSFQTFICCNICLECTPFTDGLVAITRQHLFFSHHDKIN